MGIIIIICMVQFMFIVQFMSMFIFGYFLFFIFLGGRVSLTRRLKSGTTDESAPGDPKVPLKLPSAGLGVMFHF
jgi:hypothetical protein